MVQMGTRLSLFSSSDKILLLCVAVKHQKRLLGISPKGLYGAVYTPFYASARSGTSYLLWPIASFLLTCRALKNKQRVLFYSFVHRLALRNGYGKDILGRNGDS